MALRQINTEELNEDTLVEDIAVYDGSVWYRISKILVDVICEIEDFDDTDMFYLLGFVGGVSLFAPFEEKGLTKSIREYFLASYITTQRTMKFASVFGDYLLGDDE